MTSRSTFDKDGDLSLTVLPPPLNLPPGPAVFEQMEETSTVEATTTLKNLGRDRLNMPLVEFSEEDFRRIYLEETHEDGSARTPIKPEDFSDPFLFPMLSRNEILRLRYLWYYSRYIQKDDDLLSRLQDQVDLVNEFMGKDCVILGLLDHDKYERIVTANIPLVTMPRSESTCSHTMVQPGSTVFMLKDMRSDWRFCGAPATRLGGINFYAGTQLRYKPPKSESEIAFGSLCVASFGETDVLTLSQQKALIKFSDIIVSTILERAHSVRLAERDVLVQRLAKISETSNASTVTQIVTEALSETYPYTEVSIQIRKDDTVLLSNRSSISYKSFKDCLWEDNDAISDIVIERNHLPSSLDTNSKTIRAIAVKMRYHDHVFLVVETNALKKIFDDVDVWFVSSCALLVCNIMQSGLLQRTMEAKSKFIRGVSHELRTPIHAILSSCELLLEDGNSPISNSRSSTSQNSDNIEKTLSMLRTIDNSGRELLSTINNLLDYDQFEKESTPRIMQLHSLNAIEDAVLSDLRATYMTQPVNLVSDNQLPLEVELIVTDFDLLKQCLEQLLRNAMRYTEVGTVVLQTVLSPNYEYLEYNVFDTGIGIAAEDHERIFAPFEKVGRTQKGAGLGLTVAANVSKVLDGSVRLVSSVLGQGSHFQLVLRNPILANPVNAYAKRFRDFRMPLTYYMPIEKQLETVHLTYSARALERMGFKEKVGKEALFIIVEAKGQTDSFEDIFSSVLDNQIIIYIHERQKELNEITNSIQKIPIAKRCIPCMAPVQRSLLWQVVDTAGKIYEDVTSKTSPESQVTLHGVLGTLQKVAEIAITGPPGQQNHHRDTKRAFEGLRVLIVDDNPTNLAILVMYCKKRKYVYETAMNGREAHKKFLEASKRNEFMSLVLMDLDMPIQNGIDATRDIRSLEKQEGLQPSLIFMVTGQNSDKDKKQAVDAGANGYYVKPVSIKTFDTLIQLHFPK